MKSLCFFLMLVSYLSVQAQPITFFKQWGDVGRCRLDRGFSAYPTTDGGYIILGYRTMSEGHGTVLMKTNEKGDSLWMKKYEYYYLFYTSLTKISNDGGYIIAGSNEATRININGDLIWLKKYPKSSGIYHIIETADGFLLGGYKSDSSFLSYYLLKINASGDSLWSNSFRIAELNYIKGLLVLEDNSIMALGKSMKQGSPSSAKAILIKMNSVGDTIWSKNMYNFVNTGIDQFALKQTPDKGFLLGGGGASSCIKTDSLGNKQWEKDYSVTDMHIHTNSAILLSNEIRKIDLNSGNTIWGKNIDSLLLCGFDCTRNISIQPTSDGGYIIAGVIKNTNGSCVNITFEDDNMSLIKMDSLGNFPTSIKKDDIIKSTSLKVYPNPTYNLLFVQLPFHPHAGVSIEIYDSMGRLIISKTTHKQDESIETQILKPSVYRVIVREGGVIKATASFVKI